MTASRGVDGLAGKCLRFVTNRSRWLGGEVRHFLWFAYDQMARLVVCHGARRRRVLFVAMNELALKQFVLFRNVFEGDERVDFTVTHSPRGIANRELIEQWCREHGVPYLSFARARWRPWDLMVFADHDEMSRFPVCVPKIRIPHGIGGVRLVGGVPYQWDPAWVNHRGKPFYTRMFEASHRDAEFAVHHNPQLRGGVVPVGHLVADHLLSLTPRRDAVRTSMGYAEKHFVVLFQSTHGAHSLMESIGNELVPQCVSLAAETDFRFILQTHPHHWTGPYAQEHPYGQLLLEHEGKPGITVIYHDDDWAPYMIASDMVITDHTSLSLMYALLGKPMLFVDVPGTTLVQGNPGHRLAQILPKLSFVADLAKDIERARDNFPREEVAAIAEDILSYPGEAAKRIRAEVHRLLGLAG